MIEIITSRESLDSIKCDWEQLFEADSTATPFQRFEYIVASLNFNENWDNLHILIYRLDSKKVVAIFPFVLQKGRLEFINARHTDFCNALIDPAHNNYSLYRSVAEYIKENKKIKTVRLENLLRDSSLIASFKADFPYSIIRDCNFYSSVNIRKKVGDTYFTDGITTLNSNKRGKLKAQFKKFEKNTAFQLCNVSNTPYPEDIINGIIDEMTSSGKRSRDCFDARFMQFCKDLYESGLLSIGILSENGEPKICEINFIDKKRREYITWIIVYVQSHWNSIANIRAFEWCYHNEMSINFARGIYPYKMTNFHPSVYPLFRVDIAKTKWGHFKNMLSAAIYYVKPVVKQIIGRQ